MKLVNKTIVIIGAGGLLGKQFCETLVNAGANIVVADRDLSSAKSVCNDLIKKGIHDDKIIAHGINIIDKDSIVSLIDSSISKFGKIDGVVNTAYPRNKNYGSKFESVTFEDFCENTNMNIGGYFLVSQQFSDFFSKNGGGDIVNIASIYGVIAPKFEIYEGTKMTMPVEYSVIKSGLIHLGQYISKYYRGKGVRVNTISPGGIFDGQDETFVSQYNSQCNDIGMLSPLEIANALLFVFSDYSKGISGQNIIVDDGFTL